MHLDLGSAHLVVETKPCLYFAVHQTVFEIWEGTASLSPPAYSNTVVGLSAPLLTELTFLLHCRLKYFKNFANGWKEDLL